MGQQPTYIIKKQEELPNCSQHELKPVSHTQVSKCNSKTSGLRSLVPVSLDLVSGLDVTGKCYIEWATCINQTGDMVRRRHLFTPPLRSFLLAALSKLILPLLLSGLTVIIVLFIVVISRKPGVMPAMMQQGNAVRNAACQIPAGHTDWDAYCYV